MSIAESLLQGFERRLQKYPDETYISVIIANIKSHFYSRALKKYWLTGEALSFLSGYAMPQVVISRLIPDSPGFMTGPFPSSAPAYMLGRAIDDMADGDLDPRVFGYDSFPSYVKAAKRQIENNSLGVKKDFTIDFLLKYTLEKLEKEQKPGDNVRHDWTMFLDAMMFEYKRRKKGLVLTKDEMKTLYDNSFGYAHNIMLISLHSQTRFNDINEIGQIQGRIFAISDLKKELFLSICNIPKGVMDKADLDLNLLKEDPDLINNNQEIMTWMKEELASGKELINQLKQKIPHLDKNARFYLWPLIKGVESKIKKIF